MPEKTIGLAFVIQGLEVLEPLTRAVLDVCLMALVTNPRSTAKSGKAPGFVGLDLLVGKIFPIGRDSLRGAEPRLV